MPKSYTTLFNTNLIKHVSILLPSLLQCAWPYLDFSAALIQISAQLIEHCQQIKLNKNENFTYFKVFSDQSFFNAISELLTFSY